MEPKIGTFHDVLTGEIVVRELTEQEIIDFGQVVDYLSLDAPVVEEPATEEETVKESIVVAEEPVDDEES
jgi:hypothetical protein